MNAALTKRGLDGTSLKLIAMALMVLDHIHYFFEYTGAVPVWFSMLGRLPAEMFLFFVAEGFAHTHDRRKYFLRVWAVGAPMGLVRFLMLYAGLWNRPDGFVPANGILLNFVILMVQWQGIDWLFAGRRLRGAAALLGPAVWPFAVSAVWPWLVEHTVWGPTVLGALCYSALPCWTFLVDGGLPYLIGGLLLYLLRRIRLSRGAQLGVWGLYLFGFYFLFVWWMASRQPGFAFGQMFTTYYEWYCVFCIPLLLCYNGQRGKGLKPLFYSFYPAHIALLYALSWAWMVR